MLRSSTTPPSLVRTKSAPIASGSRAEHLLEPHAHVVAVAALLERRDVEPADPRLDDLGERARVDAERRRLLAVGDHAISGSPTFRLLRRVDEAAALRAARA